MAEYSSIRVCLHKLLFTYLFKFLNIFTSQFPARNRSRSSPEPLRISYLKDAL